MEDKNQNNITSAGPDDAREAAQSDQNAELEICKKQTEEYLNNWKRERADFVNYKKEEAKRMEEFIKFANESLILELLDIMDDLDLAARQVKDSGLEQIIKKFEDLFKKYGVEKIKIGDPVKSPDGDNGASKFDPMLHEIIEGTEGEKIEEIRAGYTMHGKVVRPARVKIVK